MYTIFFPLYAHSLTLIIHTSTQHTITCHCRRPAIVDYRCCHHSTRPVEDDPVSSSLSDDRTCSCWSLVFQLFRCHCLMTEHVPVCCRCVSSRSSSLSDDRTCSCLLPLVSQLFRRHCLMTECCCRSSRSLSIKLTTERVLLLPDWRLLLTFYQLLFQLLSASSSQHCSSVL